MNTCYLCNSKQNIIKSNNPLVKDICVDCIKKNMDINTLEGFAFLCRTFNFYFNPALYINLYKESPDIVVQRYVEQLQFEENHYTDDTTDNWVKVQEEWSKTIRHEIILAKIQPIKESFLERCKIKWNDGFTFYEYIRLEDLFINTVRNYNITDPIKLDNIKKVCRSAVMLDQVYAGGDTKEIKEFTTAHVAIQKAAGLEELGQTLSDSDETIKTVASLYKYLEKKGFNFTFYDDVERDIIDKTINDIKESIRYEIVNATGLEDTLEQIQRQYTKNLMEEEEKAALEETPLEDLIDNYDRIEFETDKEFAEQDVEIDLGIDYD